MIPKQCLKRPYHLVVFKLKCCIGEAVSALLICTKPPLISGIQRWVAREAGPAVPPIFFLFQFLLNTTENLLELWLKLWSDHRWQKHISAHLYQGLKKPKNSSRTRLFFF